MRSQVSMAGWVLCMILVLAALAGVLGETRYEKFQRQHVDNPRTPIANGYCNTMMRRRQVLAPRGLCKSKNTFVHARVGTLVATCYQAPINNTNLHITSRALSITNCLLRGGSTRPPCYYTDQQRQHRVVIGCVNGLPVHLERTFP